MRPENVVSRNGALKDEVMIGHAVLDAGVHAVVLVEGDGTPVLRMNGTRYTMRRPNAVELARMLRAAAEHDPPMPSRSGSR
jgi:hypothetical protein